MFTDLAVIDWIALAFAAVLLAGAVAAGLLAYATSAHRHRLSLAMLRSRKSAPSEPDPLSGAERSNAHDTSGEVDIDLTIEEKPSPRHAVERDADDSATSDADRRLAERAARLRGRPIPESKPAAEAVEHRALEHRALVHQAVPNRSPEHAAVLTPPPIPLRSGVTSVHANFDKAAGFKARTPGFFDDPMGRHELRYWDGHTWTEYVKEHGERFTDPL